jgi:3-hydroxyisobutyrate dehydrogenase-like beta-hydroxyacid dehydrogenase
MGSQAVSTKHAIGFIGLGRMGLPMASNLYRWLRSQPEHNQQSFTVYNRSISKIQAFLRELSEENTEAVGAESVTLEQLNEVARPLGITVAASPAQVYQQSQLIITSLADDTAVLSIYDQLLPAQDAEREPEATNITRIFVDTSTVSSATTRATVQMIHARSPGARFLACPVFGPPAAARAATIVGVLSGREDAVAIAKHYFLPAICRKLIQTATTIDESLTGGDPAEEEILLALQATKLKLVGNFFLFGVGELIAESMTIADASGISRGHLLVSNTTLQF